MMNIERTRRESKTINLTSLIDVMFMLMVFFILTTNYVSVEALKLAVIDDKAIPSNKPAVKHNEIVLIGNGSTFVNGEMVYYGDLEDRLEVLFKRTAELPISIQCDDKVNVQMLVEVLDMVKRTGGKNVRVAHLDKPEQPQQQEAK